MLETDRLVLRDWIDEDLPHLIRLRGNPEVMCHFAGTDSPEKVRGYFPQIRENSAKSGYAFRPVLIKSSGEFAGFCGISAIRFEAPGLPETEIGWSLFPQYWKRGYATEAARRWLQHGFEEAGLEEIVAFAVTQNLPSHAVMRRLGMRRDAARDFDHPNVPDTFPDLKRHVVYSMKRSDWLG